MMRFTPPVYKISTSMAAPTRFTAFSFFSILALSYNALMDNRVTSVFTVLHSPPLLPANCIFFFKKNMGFSWHRAG